MKNFYYILGVEQTASFETIKKAYRKLSIKFHPDKNDGDKFFEERFKEIQEAYATLSDIGKRKRFDIELTEFLSKNKSDFNFRNFEEQIKKEYEDKLKKESERFKKVEESLKKKESELINEKQELGKKLKNASENIKTKQENEFKERIAALEKERKELERQKLLFSHKTITRIKTTSYASLVIAVFILIVIAFSGYYFIQKKSVDGNNVVEGEELTIEPVDKSNEGDSLIINSIQDYFRYINSLSNLTVYKKDYKCGWISIRENKSSPVKFGRKFMTTTDCYKIQEFYLQNEQLRFLFEIENCNNGVQNEYRYYFDNGKLIKVISSKNENVALDSVKIFEVFNSILADYKNGKRFDNRLCKCL